MSYSSSKGNVLVITLVLLLIFTLVGVASVGDVAINQHISGNFKDSNLSFQAAEAALKEGELLAENLAASHDWENFSSSCSGTNCFTTTCSAGLCFNGDYPTTSDCASNPPTTGLWSVDATWDSVGAAAVAVTNFPTLSEKPKYIIEFMCFVPRDPVNTPSPTSNYPSGEWSFMYRITGYSAGEGGNSKVAVQSTYKVDLP